MFNHSQRIFLPAGMKTLKVSIFFCLILYFCIGPVWAVDSKIKETDTKKETSKQEAQSKKNSQNTHSELKRSRDLESNETAKKQDRGADEDVIQKHSVNPRYGENVLEVSWMTAPMWGIGNPGDYFYIPQMASIHWQLDDVGNPGWRRGNTEWVTSFFISPIVEGPESRMLGFAMGPRYNFVQPDSKWVPYVESQVGLLWIDSVDVEEHPGAQGQDFCFTFFVGCGVRYDFNEHWTASAGIVYQHISNGGLSEPERKNSGLDAVGPSLSLLYKF